MNDWLVIKSGTDTFKLKNRDGIWIVWINSQNFVLTPSEVQQLKEYLDCKNNKNKTIQ